jgi:hypothetical protein
MNGILGFADLLKEPGLTGNAARIRLYNRRKWCPNALLLMI